MHLKTSHYPNIEVLAPKCCHNGFRGLTPSCLAAWTLTGIIATELGFQAWGWGLTLDQRQQLPLVGAGGPEVAHDLGLWFQEHGASKVYSS